MRRLLLLVLILSACAVPTATPRATAPTLTPRPFPSFGPTRTVTPTRTPRTTPTETATPTLEVTAIDTPTPSSANRTGGAVANQPSVAHSASQSSGQIERSAIPALLTRALIEAGVADPKVYWFTFDEGDREQALMVQYASPLRWQPGYLDMLRTAQKVLGRTFMSIEPPIYSAFVAGVDIAGDSDITVRLRRSSAEKLARGEISAEDFANNYFEYINIVINCTADGCLAKMATPFPTFDFPFPFPYPTPTTAP